MDIFSNQDAAKGVRIGATHWQEEGECGIKRLTNWLKTPHDHCPLSHRLRRKIYHRHPSPRYSGRCHAPCQTLDIGRRRPGARRQRGGIGTYRPQLFQDVRLPDRQGLHRDRDQPEGAGALRGLRQRHRDPRRRLRRHPARGGEGPCLRTPHSPHRAGAAAGAGARRARQPIGARCADRLPDRGGGRDQGGGSDQPAALRSRISLDCDDRHHRRHCGRGQATRPQSGTNAACDRYRRQPGGGPEGKLRHHDQAIPSRPLVRERRRGGGIRQARLDRNTVRARGQPRFLHGRRWRLRRGGDRRQARQSVDLRVPGCVNQAASERFAHASRHGEDAQLDPRTRHPARTGGQDKGRHQPPYAERAHSPPAEERAAGQVQHGVLHGDPAARKESGAGGVHRQGRQPA